MEILFLLSLLFDFVSTNEVFFHEVELISIVIDSIVDKLMIVPMQTSRGVHPNSAGEIFFSKYQKRF